MSTQGAGDCLHRLELRAHRTCAPTVEELTAPRTLRARVRARSHLYFQRQHYTLDQSCRPVHKRPMPLNPIQDSLDLHPVLLLQVDGSLSTPSSQSLERGALSTTRAHSQRLSYPQIPLKNQKFIDGIVAARRSGLGGVAHRACRQKHRPPRGEATEGYSGTTAWHNAPRARWFLYSETQEDAEGVRAKTSDRILELQKSQRSEHEGERIRIRWDKEAGTFVGDKISRAGKVDIQSRDRHERGAIMACFEAFDYDRDHVPESRRSDRNCFKALSVSEAFPESLKSGGRAAKQRFYRHIETLHQQGRVDKYTVPRKGDRPLKCVGLPIIASKYAVSQGGYRGVWCDAVAGVHPPPLRRAWQK